MHLQKVITLTWANAAFLFLGSIQTASAASSSVVGVIIQNVRIANRDLISNGIVTPPSAVKFGPALQKGAR
jgi:hypothetical protein